MVFDLEYWILFSYLVYYSKRKFETRVKIVYSDDFEFGLIIWMALLLLNFNSVYLSKDKFETGCETRSERKVG